MFISCREVPDYGIAIEDQEIPDYALDGLVDEDGIHPEQNKQLVPKPPPYEESLADKIKEGEKSMLILNIYRRSQKICLQHMMRMKFLTMLWVRKTELLRF